MRSVPCTLACAQQPVEPGQRSGLPTPVAALGLSSRRVSALRWRLLVYLTTSYAAGAFGVLGVSPLSPVLLSAFELTRFEVGLLLPAVYVGGLIVSLPAGQLADRFGARVCLLGGLALSGVLL